MKTYWKFWIKSVQKWKQIDGANKARLDTYLVDGNAWLIEGELETPPDSWTQIHTYRNENYEYQHAEKILSMTFLYM